MFRKNIEGAVAAAYTGCHRIRDRPELISVNSAETKTGPKVIM